MWRTSFAALLLLAGCGTFQFGEPPVPKPPLPGVPYREFTREVDPNDSPLLASISDPLDGVLARRFGSDKASRRPSRTIPRESRAQELPFPTDIENCISTVGFDVSEAAEETGCACFIAGAVLTSNGQRFPVRWDIDSQGKITAHALSTTRQAHALCVAPSGLVGGVQIEDEKHGTPIIWNLRGDEIYPDGIYGSGMVTDISSVQGALIVSDGRPIWWHRPGDKTWMRGFEKTQKDVEILAMSETGLVVGTINATSDRPIAAYWTESGAFALPDLDDNAPVVGAALSISPDGRWAAGIATTETGCREAVRWRRNIEGRWEMEIADPKRPVVGAATQIVNYGLAFGQYTGRKADHPGGAFAWDGNELSSLDRWLSQRGVDMSEWKELANVTGAMRIQDRVFLVGVGRKGGRPVGYFVNTPAAALKEQAR